MGSEWAATADALYAATRHATPIAPPAQTHPGLTIADSYRIQSAGRSLRLAEGGVLVGHKIGLTSSAMQEMLGVDQPDFGYLLESMVHRTGCVLDADQFIAPRVEAEIAFRLRAALSGPDVTAADVLEATEAVAPAIEVIDSRVADWKITIVDTVADNASCGCAVIGPWSDPNNTDLGTVEGTLTVTDTDGSKTVSSGPGSAVLGHPALAIAWLTRALYEIAGESLAAGEIVIPGAVARAVPIARGGHAHLHFAELGDAVLTMQRSSRD
jgi:2-keto-4-pentenoate hydratase